jgi:hypothetical protein
VGQQPPAPDSFGALSKGKGEKVNPKISVIANRLVTGVRRQCVSGESGTQKGSVGVLARNNVSCGFLVLSADCARFFLPAGWEGRASARPGGVSRRHTGKMPVPRRAAQVWCLGLRLSAATKGQVFRPALFAYDSGWRFVERRPNGPIHHSPGQAERSPGYRRPATACPEGAPQPNT